MIVFVGFLAVVFGCCLVATANLLRQDAAEHQYRIIVEKAMASRRSYERSERCCSSAVAV